MDRQDAIFVAGLTRTWKAGRRHITALQNLTLRVPAGCAFGLLGPNGAGKTTFVKIITGAVRPDSGTASIFGHAAGSREAARRIGYMPESHGITRHLSPRQLLDFHGSLLGLDRAVRRQRIPEILEQLGLLSWMDVPVGKFSKGMLQRAGLAAALLHRPDLLVLDEPTDGLDPAGRRSMLDILAGLRREGVTLLINSHLLSEVQELCDEVAILRQGTLMRQMRTGDLSAGFLLRIGDAHAALVSLLLTRLDLKRTDARTVEVRVRTREQADWAVGAAVAAGARVESLTAVAQSLEDVYLAETEGLAAA